MYRIIFTLTITTLFQAFSYGQICESDRYEKAVFSDVTVTEDLTYSSAEVYDAFNLPIEFNFKLDVYEPTGDVLEKRPMVIMQFGGAYIFGSKQHADMVAWCDSLASYGYVAVSIDYRLALNPLSEGSAIRAMYRGVQDTRAAIRYMLEHQTEYKIDPNNIYLGGESAGAINSLHAAFMTTEAERPDATYGIPFENYDMGCLDCSGNDFQHSFDIKGIIDLWGGVLELDYISANESISTLIIHGKDDFIVPFDEGFPFASDFDLSFPYIYASKAIHDKMDDLNICNEYYIYPDLGHLFYGLPDGIITFPNEQWVPVWTQGHEFLYKTLEFDSPSPIGENQVNVDWNYIYSVPATTGSIYCWSVTGGTIVSDDNNEITVQWNEGTGGISVIETNYIDVVGFESELMQVEATVGNNDIEADLGVKIYPTKVPYGQNVNILNPSSLELELMVSTINGQIIDERIITSNAQLGLHEMIADEVLNYYFITITHEGKYYTQKILVY
jgi:acetyl esterase/lipase